MRFSVLPFAALVVSFANAGSAQQAHNNPFFGFEYILTPIAVKWACGGAQAADMAGFERVVAAFPQAAAQAQIPAYLKEMQGASDVAEVLGEAISADEERLLCEAAGALTVSWLTPEMLLSASESSGDAAQDQAWARFFALFEE